MFCVSFATVLGFLPRMILSCVELFECVARMCLLFGCAVSSVQCGWLWQLVKTKILLFLDGIRCFIFAQKKNIAKFPRLCVPSLNG